MHHETPSADLLARLYLEAVVPAMGELVAIDATARQAVGAQPWQVELSTAANKRGFIHFDGTQVTATANDTPAPVRLRFLSDEHLVAVFCGNARLPPLPVGGFVRLFRLRRFTTLSTRLTDVMNPQAGMPELRTRLLFGGLLVRALRVLCECQHSAAAALQPFKRFMCCFRIPHEAVSWFGSDGQFFAAGAGEPPGPVQLEIRFRNLEVACSAAAGQLDHLAAIGAGDIEIIGLTPLGDALDVLLDRVDRYLR